jgi:hypothetical protein
MRQRALGAHQGALEKERARTPPLPQRERRIDGGCGALACVGQVVDETRRSAAWTADEVCALDDESALSERCEDPLGDDAL